MRYKTYSLYKDKITEFICKSFDLPEQPFKFEYTNPFKDKLPINYNIGLIVGRSGSGKSLILEDFGKEELILWDDTKPIVSHFLDENDAVDKLSAVSLNSIPSWLKPYKLLSNGEKFRADIARKIKSNIIIDEFSSTVDRITAKGLCVSLRKYIDKNKLTNIVMATCHDDIIDWIEPDWVFNTLDNQLIVGRSKWQKPQLQCTIHKCPKEYWSIFKNHHYLTANINNAAHTYILLCNNDIVGFIAMLSFPHNKIKDAWRIHRAVILPEYQGYGIGTKFICTIADLYKSNNKRVFIRTAHIKLGNYFTNNKKWRPTSTNLVQRKAQSQQYYNGWSIDLQRRCYSFEYIG